MNRVLSYKSLPIKKRYFADPKTRDGQGAQQVSSSEIQVKQGPKRMTFSFPLDSSESNSFGKKHWSSYWIPALSFLLVFDADSGSCPGSPSSSLKCPKCPKMFSSENALKIHHRRHLNKQSGRYKCKLCGQTFSQRSGQVSHSRVHTREKPYNCDQCPKRFADFSTFTKHKRVHTGEKPYSCTLCDRNFSQSGNLHRHVRVIHLKKS